ncbi:hypothetical protein COBT_000817 [Conglomerata obtusa]
MQILSTFILPYTLHTNLLLHITSNRCSNTIDDVHVNNCDPNTTSLDIIFAENKKKELLKIEKISKNLSSIQNQLLTAHSKKIYNGYKAKIMNTSLYLSYHNKILTLYLNLFNVTDKYLISNEEPLIYEAKLMRKSEKDVGIYFRLLCKMIKIKKSDMCIMTDSYYQECFKSLSPMDKDNINTFLTHFEKKILNKECLICGIEPYLEFLSEVLTKIN